MRTEPGLRGLYAITADTRAPDFLARVEAALKGGAAVLQYRDKQAEAVSCTQARAVQALCGRYRVPLIVNDDPRLAAEVDAAGVHLGRDDPALAQARFLVGPDRLIGVSCYDSLALAIEAERAGADYVAFGSFYASPTKPHAVRAPVALLREARARLRVPIVAIGGITPENGAPLVAAGADALAVIEGVFGQADSEAAARRYAALFRRGIHG